MSRSVSREAATATLKKFYDNTTSDSVSIDDIFVNFSRTDKKREANMLWLYNKMSTMRKYDFFEKKYTIRNKVRALDRIVLTEEGRIALGRNKSESFLQNASQDSNTPPVTFETVKRDIEALRKQFPSLDITYDVSLKRGG